MITDDRARIPSEVAICQGGITAPVTDATLIRSIIDVAAAVDDGIAVVVVRDNGPGLDDDAVVHVFDRFWQADRARSGTGAGLGLSIVAGIAAEHGGSATAANAAGGGAQFTLRLPVTSSG